MNDDTTKDLNWDALQMTLDFGAAHASKENQAATASEDFVAAASKWFRDYFAKPHRSFERSLATNDFLFESPSQTKFEFKDHADIPLSSSPHRHKAENVPISSRPETARFCGYSVFESTWGGKGSEKIVLDGPRSGLPDLHAAVLTFSARLLKYVNERFDGDGPNVYHRAHLEKSLYSRVTTNNLAKVSKNTALKFAIGLKLDRTDAERLLKSAGFAFSNSIPWDMAVLLCIENEKWDMDIVNKILVDNGYESMD